MTRQYEVWCQRALVRPFIEGVAFPCVQVVSDSVKL